jgi:methyl-accepting chemotaxis protein
MTNQTVAKLGESSAEIGQIMKVITSIAEQTNMLALNATIEAARAGEAGRGFAVVANEVKELAKETARATEDISRKIAAIRVDATDATTALTEISGIITEISELQSSISTAVEEQAATTDQIAQNIGEAARGAADITTAVGSVASSLERATELATETRTCGQKLAGFAEQLEEHMSAYDPGTTEATLDRRGVGERRAGRALASHPPQRSRANATNHSFSRH